MSIGSILIANRGEIAIRVARTAAELGVRTIGVYSQDDASSLHRAKVDEAVELPGQGPVAYLDIDAILAVAKAQRAQAIHPGYGFLAENASFAERCEQAGIKFIGPAPRILTLCGDKAAARGLAQEAGLPIMRGTPAGISVDDARAFMDSVGDGGAIMLKAASGGGGIGMRPVERADDLEAAFERCESEATAAFGDGSLYAERLFRRARHVEVQVLGDGSRVQHLGERECSLQRQRQKIVEMAPAADLDKKVRDAVLRAAKQLAGAMQLDNLSTVEFLVDATPRVDEPDIAFMEVNARIQVEHTVTEEVTGLDLVELQIRLAEGRSLASLGLDAPPELRGAAIQARVNLESMTADGTPRPAGGMLSTYEPPSGLGIRVDGYGYAGYTSNPRFDSLLAKVIAYTPRPDMNQARVRLIRALGEFGIEGANTNAAFLRALLSDDDCVWDRLHTNWIEQAASRLVEMTGDYGATRSAHSLRASGGGEVLAGAKVDATDPLAVLAYGKGGSGASEVGQATGVASPSVVSTVPGPEGTKAVAAPMQGTIVSLEVEEGQGVRAGEPLLVMEAMKMEHLVAANISGIVREIRVAIGDTVFEGHALAFVEPAEVGLDDGGGDESVDLDEIRSDLAEVLERKAKTLDENRPQALARRRKTNQRTVRENVDAVIDAGTFVEYGAFTLAARRLRMEMDELIDRTPADGLVCGTGLVNGDLFPDEDARAMVVAYDYTVLAGTQGKKNHQKKDRMFSLAGQWRIPLILFAEGGGGRPGDTDVLFGANLQVEAFHLFGKLSGLVPLVGITSGRCFAGNAVLLGCCDVIIATANSTIGMGGPAMIEGGGLGVYTPEEVGPMSVQVPNGVVDVAVDDEREAAAVARQYLSYFQGTVSEWSCPDQRRLRRLVPENRLRIYDVRKVIDVLADDGSVLEIRAGYGYGMVTAFIRIEGKPIGLIANNPAHLGGAIDSDASDKAARFMQLCDAFDIPILTLCDTPGNMVGPEHERTALVRHCCRMFVIGANITVPLVTVVLRKGYGLGAQGMAGGSFHAPLATLSWPTGEYGGMGLEGAVKLGFRDQLEAIEDPEERLAAYEERVAEMYERGKAISIASYFELDDVIDPAETRKWVMAAFRSAPPPPDRTGKKRNNIDAW